VHAGAVSAATTTSAALRLRGVSPVRGVDAVTVRELPNNGGQAPRRVELVERILVTRDGMSSRCAPSSFGWPAWSSQARLKIAVAAPWPDEDGQSCSSTAPVANDQPLLGGVLIDVLEDLLERKDWSQRDRRLARMLWPSEFDPRQHRSSCDDSLVHCGDHTAGRLGNDADAAHVAPCRPRESASEDSQLASRQFGFRPTTIGRVARWGLEGLSSL
jgi:hypothetical protein